MASAQDMWRGRDRQPRTLGSPRPRRRSESRRLSDRRRPVNTAARKCDRVPGALHEGDKVRVFSRSADKWVDGEIVKFAEDNFVRVEYEIDEHWCGKILHAHSEHLEAPCSLQDARGGTLSKYFLQKHTSDGVRNLSLPPGFYEENDGYVHAKSGVSVHSQPIRLYARGCSYQVLFHYTQKKFFDMIVQSRGTESTRSLLKASRDLSNDCDFGVGVYATAKGPDEFHDGIQGILLNNYPRKGKWGGAGEPGEEYHDLASHCIPIIVPTLWTKSFPLTSEVSTGSEIEYQHISMHIGHGGGDAGALKKLRSRIPFSQIYGPILEEKMRQGHAFNPDRHNIYVIHNSEIEKLGKLADGGHSAERRIIYGKEKERELTAVRKKLEAELKQLEAESRAAIPTRAIRNIDFLSSGDDWDF